MIEDSALLPFESVEAHTATPTDACILWLHGLGADGYDFVPVAEMLAKPGWRFVLPHAPQQAVTFNGGYRMPAWYDIFTLDRDGQQDEHGIRAMSHRIESLIRAQMSDGIAPERIVLAGFSQGGAMALHTALRFPEKLAGVLALSTYLPLKSSLPGEAHPINRTTPIFMAHGEEDNIIAIATAEHARDTLQQEGYPVSWHAYAMGHTVTMDEIEDIRDFLNQMLTDGKT